MSTRCQTKVFQTGTGWDQAVTLYHHCDGYPSAMLPLFAEAWLKFGTGSVTGNAFPYKRGWECGRAGHVASYLCATDPDGFEPEEGHGLHGDIEWYYTLECRNASGGSMAESPEWFVQVHDIENVFTDDAKPVPIGEPISCVALAEMSADQMNALCETFNTSEVG